MTTGKIRWTLILGIVLTGGRFTAAKAEEPTTKPDASSSTNSRREQMRQRFGNIDPAKIAEMRKQRQGGGAVAGGNALANVDLDALFKKLDTDGDGKLSADEFKKLAENLPSTAAATAGPARGRGNIDPERLKQMRERFGNRSRGGTPATGPAAAAEKPADAQKAKE